MAYFVALEGQPRLLMPGLFPFDALPDAVRGAKAAYNVMRVPLVILTAPAGTATRAYEADRRAFAYVDGITAASWAEGPEGAGLTIREAAQITTSIPPAVPEATGEFTPDGEYHLSAFPLPTVDGNPRYRAELREDPQDDAAQAGEDPTPGPLAAPTPDDIAAGIPGLWEWRVVRFIDDPALVPWSEPGGSVWEFENVGPLLGWQLEAQDAHDEVGTSIARPAASFPPPTVSGRWEDYRACENEGNPDAIPDWRIYCTVTLPPGVEWVQNGGHLLRVIFGAGDGRTPGEWNGPGFPLGDGRSHTSPCGQTQATGLDISPDGRTAGGFTWNLGDAGGQFCVIGWAVYATAPYSPGRQGEGRLWLSTEQSVIVSDCSLGPPPDVPPRPDAPPDRDPSGCIGAKNSSGWDAQRGEYYITGDRNRLRVGGGLNRATPHIDAGIVTDDSGTAIGAALEYLFGTPCVELGVGAGVGHGRTSAGPYLAVGVGGPHEFRIPL